VAELVDRETGDGMTVEEVAALVEEHGLAVTSVEKVARFVHERQQQITTEGTVRVEEEEEGRI
jgi:predicted xylose isomerase-like sugar epimerase